MWEKYTGPNSVTQYVEAASIPDSALGIGSWDEHAVSLPHAT